MDNAGIFFLIFGLSNNSIFLDKLMIFSTKYLVYLTFIFSFILAIKGKSKEKKSFLLTLFAIPMAILVIKIVHIFIDTQRPFVVYNFTPLTDYLLNASFPSRHATLSGVLAFSYVIFHSKWSYLFLTFLILIGISRVYIGVHYPLDIIGGFITAGFAIYATIFFIKLLRLIFFKKSF